MQTNIAEIDATRYDIPWWREHWKRTHTQGVVVNAGGLVAFYPTKIPFHRTAQFLGDRDLFGELAKAAHDDGIVVFARMDSNGAGDDVLQAHPDWLTRNAAGAVYRDRDLNVPCVNGPFYREHIPAILREIAADVSTRRLHRQQLERPAARQHLLLRELPAEVPERARARAADEARLERSRLSRVDRMGICLSDSRSGICSMPRRVRPAAPSACGSA